MLNTAFFVAYTTYTNKNSIPYENWLACYFSLFLFICVTFSSSIPLQPSIQWREAKCLYKFYVRESFCSCFFTKALTDSLTLSKDNVKKKLCLILSFNFMAHEWAFFWEWNLAFYEAVVFIRKKIGWLIWWIYWKSFKKLQQDIDVFLIEKNPSIDIKKSFEANLKIPFKFSKTFLKKFKTELKFHQQRHPFLAQIFILIPEKPINLSIPQKAHYRICILLQPWREKQKYFPHPIHFFIHGWLAHRKHVSGSDWMIDLNLYGLNNVFFSRGTERFLMWLQQYQQ